MKVRQFIRRLVRHFIPAPIRDKAKAVVGALGLVVQVVNLTVPDYGDEVKTVVAAIVAVATFAGIYDVPNVPADEVVERPRQRQRP